MRTLNYDDLAKKLFEKIYNAEYNEDLHKGTLSSIVSEFYNIQDELLEHLKIDCSVYEIEERIDIIEMLYEFKHLYYSKSKIISFIKDKVNNKEQYTDIVGLFHEYNKKALNMKEYKNLNKCERIFHEESDYNKALSLIESSIEDDEKTIIKRIGKYDVSENLLQDLKRYYLRIGICEKYIEEISIMSGLNLEMSMMYSDFLSRLRHRLFKEDLSKEHKNYICNSLTNILKKVKEELDKVIGSNKNNEYDMLVLFYLRINRLEIARTLEYSNKILQLLNRQSELLKLDKYDNKVQEDNDKITNIWRAILIDEENLTDSNKRILQMENKDTVPILKDRYKGKFRLLDNDNLKIKKLILRESYIDKKSRSNKNSNLKEIKEEYNLYGYKLSKIINKIKNNIELTNKEEVFIDTLINRGIVLEMGNIGDSINVDNIDILISEVIIKIYSLNDIYLINNYVHSLFNLLKRILNQRFKNEKKQ